METNEREMNVKSGTLSPIKIWIIFIGVMALWVLNFLLVTKSGVAEQSYGIYGDLFGAVNALFSGLAFAGLIIALLYQKDELALQRQELRLTRNELRGQKEQLELQNKTTRKQNFENTFFALLKLHNDIVNGLDITTGNNTHKGRDCFTVIYNRLKAAYSTESSRFPNHDEKKIVNGVYLNIYRSYQTDLGHYFRTLYNIVKFVDRSDVEDKKVYTNLVRAQLSNSELLILFYNTVSVNGETKFKPLIEKYALLKTMPKEYLFKKDHVNFHDSKSFG